jgi:hypothetical protein
LKETQLADKSAAERANAEFKKTQREHDAKKAMAEYDAEGAALRAKTERLRALRLARDAALPQPAPVAKKAKPGNKTGKAKSKSASLSDWLDGESKDGRQR